MATFFVIEDEVHADLHGEFETMDLALRELRERARIPSDQEPNLPPCMSWRTCHRLYEIVEYERTRPHWTEVGRETLVDISPTGVQWYHPFGAA